MTLYQETEKEILTFEVEMFAVYELGSKVAAEGEENSADFVATTMTDRENANACSVDADMTMHDGKERIVSSVHWAVVCSSCL